MRCVKRSFFPFLTALVLSALLMGTGGVEASWGVHCGTWRIVSSPNVASGIDYLQAVTAVSIGNVWAVGSSYDSSTNATVPLIEHWDGRQWSIVPSLWTGSGDSLHALAAVSANDIWAVGTRYNSGVSFNQTMAEHWDGTQWNISNDPFLYGDGLFGVAAISAHNTWVVGDHFNHFGTLEPLIAHCDSTACWSIASISNLGSSAGRLYAVTALSAQNIWAVGTYGNDGSFTNQPLIVHWDGTQWSIVSNPTLGSSNNVLTAMTAVSPRNIWAVGNSYDSRTSISTTLIEHWDGTQWSIVSSPNVVPKDGLSGVTALTASSIWAVGDAYIASTTTHRALVEHWDGAQWSIVSIPTVGSSDSLSGIARVPHTKRTWAVGYDKGNTTYQTLTAFSC